MELLRLQGHYSTNCSDKIQTIFYCNNGLFSFGNYLMIGLHEVKSIEKAEAIVGDSNSNSPRN
jgi:hypothetical protein